MYFRFNFMSFLIEILQSCDNKPDLPSFVIEVDWQLNPMSSNIRYIQDRKRHLILIKLCTEHWIYFKRDLHKLDVYLFIYSF